MFPRILALASMLLPVLLCALQPAAANSRIDDIVGLYAPTTTYAITRKGKRIGTHELSFSRRDAELTVNVTSRIKVTVLRIPVFTFNYDATETWSDDQLVSAQSEVRENDKITKVSMQSEATTTVLDSGAGTKEVERLHFTSNHWNPGVTEASVVFNTLNGTASNVSITVVNDNATVNGQSATQYRYTGDIEADTWYDAAGKWLKLGFKGEDGSLIEYTIE
jgi:hypothetical protein